jgi:hypothetical protein
MNLDRPAQGDFAPGDMPLERVEAELCTLAGQIAAATARFLRLLADFDARDGWAGWGVVSCAHWLSWRCGFDLRTAHEHVRVARSLRDLPKVSDAFEQGRLSYSKARAISRVATPDNEDDLLDAALHAPAAQVERLMRGLRRAERGGDDKGKAGHQEAGAADDAESKVQWRWDDEDGSLVVWGRLRPEQGARLLAGLTRIDSLRRHNSGEPAACGQVSSAERSAGDPSVAIPDATAGSGVAGVAPSDLAPALVAAGELLCTQVDAPVHGPAADVVVHVGAGTLVDIAKQVEGASAAPHAHGAAAPEALPARIDDGPAVLSSTVHRLVCDGRIQLSVDGADGRTLDLGRRCRRPSRRQLDALWRRDRGCAHPGCGRTRFLHAHHVVSWVCGGPTDLDNLVLLCGEHHRALHDGAFSVVALGRQRFRFHGPRGAVRPQAPLTSGRADDLVAAHADIGPGTIEPDWDGSPLHLAEAVDVFCTNWRTRARRDAEPAAVAAGAP